MHIDCTRTYRGATWTPPQLTVGVAMVGGCPAEFPLANYPEPGAPEVITVTMTVGLPFNDLVAALYLWADLTDCDAMADPAYCRKLVAEAVVNSGLGELETVKAEMADAKLGTPAGALLAHCQRRALELLGLPSAPVPAPSATRLVVR